MVIAVLAAPFTARAGGWTQPAGAHYAKVWGRALLGDRAFFPDGEVRDLDGSFSDFVVQAYGEYGLTDRVTLVANLAPIGRAEFDGNSTAYVGPFEVGARYGLLRDGLWPGGPRIAFEARAGGTGLVGDEVLARGEIEGHAFEYQPVVSTWRATGELQLGVPLPFGWLAANAGGRFYGSDVLDPVVIGSLQLGFGGGTFVPDIHVNLAEPLGDPDDNVAGSGQTRYLGVGVGLTWWLGERWGFNGGLEGVAYAETNLAAPTLTIGFEHR